MSRESLVFERLVVRRMPGVANGGFELDGLVPGVNVIHGPNASGKTTTARALEALLWPQAAPANAWLEGRFLLGSARWAVSCDAGRATYQRDGADSDPPILAPAGARDRYRLSLHELLREDNADLAREIVRESAGGYDVAAAARALGARDTLPRRQTDLAKEYESARAAVREARRTQEALREEERRLAELRRRVAEAEEVGRRIRLLERALEHADAVAREQAARRELERFPEALARLQGDEADRLASLREKLEAAREKRSSARRDLEASRETIRQAGLPEGGIPDVELSALRKHVERLQELRRTLTDHEAELAAATEARQREQRVLSPVVSEAQLDALDAGAVAALADFALRGAQVTARLAAADAEIAWLRGGDDGAAASGSTDAPGGSTAAGPRLAGPTAERLGHGIALLRAWLRAGDGGRNTRRLRNLGGGAAALLLATGLAAAIATWPGLIALPGGATPAWLPALPFALTLIAFVLLVAILRVGQEPDTRAAQRAAFERTGLRGPERWTEDAVAAHLDSLEALAAEVKLAAERERRAQDAARRRTEILRELEEIETRRRALVETYGVAPETDLVSLHWLGERIGRWQDARRRETEAAAALEAVRSRFDAELAAAADRIASLGCPRPADLETLAAAIEDLAARAAAYASALREASAADRRLSEAEADEKALQEELLTLCQRIGVSPDDEATVRAWCEQLSAYREACDSYRAAVRLRQDLAAALRAMAGYVEGLENRSREELEDEVRRASARAAELEELRSQIAEIEARIRHAKQSHDLEAALARLRRCEDDLREARERDLHALLTHTLAEFVQRASRDHHRPQVFRRARELFARITHGRYRLDFDDGDPPAFRAYDETTGTGHSLDELSSATRVQLLLAVRIAFVETQEPGARLPLILDETLGNSDDARAQAIISAILTLAADGRQIFYFTAQPDEVGKWRGILETRPDIPARIIDLAETRRLARAQAEPLRIVDPPTRPIPAPGEASHEEYGRILGVPPLDPWMDPGASHLWYLVEDRHALYRLLCLGIETWGALRCLVENGGESLLGDDPSLFERARAAARALEAAIDAVRTGRGRPVDRAVLHASGAVSARFLDEVANLCAECRGDAVLLVEALAANRVPRFQKKQLEALRQYLEQNGYLETRPRLSAPEVRARTLALVAPEIQRGLVTPAQIDRILAALLPA